MQIIVTIRLQKCPDSEDTSGHLTSFACWYVAIEKKDTLFALPKDLVKLWYPAGGSPNHGTSRMVQAVDCIQGASAPIVGARRRGRFVNPGSMAANLGSREWIYGLLLIA